MDHPTPVFIFVEDGLLYIYGYRVGSSVSGIDGVKNTVSDRLFLLNPHRLIRIINTFNQQKL